MVAIAEAIGAADWKDRALDVMTETERLFTGLAACRTRDFRSITTAVRLRRRGHETAGGAPITS
jgi:hypothetical protein